MPKDTRPTLTPEAERMNLHRHGTKLVDFTAVHVLQTAKADMVRKMANERRAKSNLNSVPEYRNEMLSYAFPKSAVEKARNAAELLEIVTKKPPTPKTRDQTLLYDREKLNEALEMAQENPKAKI